MANIRHKTTVRFDLSNAEIDFYVTKAMMIGFKRVDPDRIWSRIERKEAVRFAIVYFVHDEARL